MYTPTQRGISAEKQHIREREFRAQLGTVARAITSGWQLSRPSLLMEVAPTPLVVQCP